MTRVTRRLNSLALLGLAAVLLALGGAVPIGLAAPADIDNGALEWGFKSSFRNYVTGPIAHGNIATEGGASQTGGGFRFPAGSGSYDSATGTLTVSFNGSVHFTGHNYGNGNLLDLRISNLRVQLNGSSGVLIANVASRSLESLDTDAELGPIETYSNVTLANLSGASAVTSGDSVNWSSINAVLASGGVEAFAGFYTAGTALDPLSISLTVEQAAAATATTVATATPSATATTSVTPLPTATPLPGTATPQPHPPTATPSSSTQVESTTVQAPSVGDAGLAAGR